MPVALTTKPYSSVDGVKLSVLKVEPLLIIKLSIYPANLPPPSEAEPNLHPLEPPPTSPPLLLALSVKVCLTPS